VASRQVSNAESR